ncbi:ABC transporter substrate-binding protein [Staphylococcus caprae]|uniref:nickel ABC transporter substrate-binding protein n=1 Tax=Staphylococcus caprae TaxID=29380 RepID=UPI001C82FBE9|nr:nickel ABC transporter substrate-binding protein [Staphylococcus caprae]MBX5319486.1 ABC transporter substrate-binding protein [Staphylococcus caprae]
MKKFIILIVMVSFILASCGNHSKTDKDTLNIDIPLKTKSIAPYETDIPVKVGALESLFKMSKDGKVKPLLVKSYKQKSDSTLELTLKDKIKFQDGRQLTGQAVKESLEEGMKKSDLLKGSLPIKSIDADGQKVTITTKEPYPELKSELASPFAAIYDVKAKSKVSDKPVGTGPYQINNYKRSQKLELSKFKDYWQGKPKLKKINVTYHEDGNTRVDNLLSSKSDLTTDVPIDRINDVKNSKKAEIQSTSGFRTHLLLYNHESKKMNKNVRKAFDMIINRKEIAKDVSKNYAKPASGPFNHRLKTVENGKVQNQDIKKAKKLLEQEGYTKSHPLKINMVTYDGRPELPKIGQVIQSEAKKANIDIQLRNVDDIDGYLKDTKAWDVSMYSYLTVPRGDTGYFFNTAYLPNGALNKGHYNNKEVTQLINKLNTTFGEKQRASVTNDILEKSKDDIPNSYITYNSQIDGVNNKVQNFNVTPESIYLIDYKVSKKE